MILNKSHAFSLLELLIALVVLVLLLLAGVPAIHHLVLQDRATQTANRIIAAIHYARSEAIQLHQTVTFCKSTDHKICGGEWRAGQIIITSDGRILRVYEPLTTGDELVWKSNLALNNYLRFAPSGFTYGQQGSFFYCPANKNPAYARVIVVQQSGRTRVERGSSQGCS
ncbi:MAG: GspH/FimT family protein [Gammaproteobacteria bacterium]